ncbi:hypothetical protein [Thermomonospora amylolytica]|uniref:hypothetical protein n=1 Tax=Thermomonospora amylolytica TaxID=1411117 RepID=UPI0018E508E9|nr:hypothetical protein [Thermomonospora amylolytica]
MGLAAFLLLLMVFAAFGLLVVFLVVMAIRNANGASQGRPPYNPGHGHHPPHWQAHGQQPSWGPYGHNAPPAPGVGPAVGGMASDPYYGGYSGYDGGSSGSSGYDSGGSSSGGSSGFDSGGSSGSDSGSSSF